MDEQHNHQHHMALDKHSSRRASSSDDDCEEQEDVSICDAITDVGEYRGDGAIISQLQEAQEEQRSQGRHQQPNTKRDKPDSKDTYILNRRHGTCPSCGGELVERDGPYGAFFGCSSYPRCTYTRDKRHGMTKGKSRPKIGYTAMNRYRRGPKL